MKSIKLLFLAFLLVVGFEYAINLGHNVFADGDNHEYYQQHDGHDREESPFEEIGKMIGWGTAIAMGAAGMLYPFRKALKFLLKKIPNAKNLIISFSKFLGKRHVHFGIIALILSIAHGILMYIKEGELELQGFLGLVSIILMVVAALFGTVLIKNKKAKRTRTNHTSLLVFALLIGAFHILFS